LQRSGQEVSYINLAKGTLLESLHRRFHKEICAETLHRDLLRFAKRPLYRDLGKRPLIELWYRDLAGTPLLETLFRNIAQICCRGLATCQEVSYISLARRLL